MSRIPKPINMTTGEPSWRWRRIAFFLVLLFSLTMLWRLVGHDDTALNYAIATGLIWLAAALVLIYTGFATAQDLLAIFVTKTGRPYADVPPSTGGTVEKTMTEKTTVKADPIPPEHFGSGQ